MAKFTTTPEEEEAATYLDWDDKTLGQFTKYVALKIERAANDKEGMRQVWGSSAAMILIKGCRDENVGTLTLTMEDITVKDEAIGTWEIVVRQIKKPPIKPARGK